jgi:hypothetical protein
VEIVAESPQVVEGQVRLAPSVEEPYLVVVAPGLKEGDGVVQRNSCFSDRLVSRHHLQHPGLELGQFLRREWIAAIHLAEIAAKGERVIHEHCGSRKQLVRGRDQQKDQRATIDAKAIAVGHGDWGYFDIALNSIREFA